MEVIDYIDLATTDPEYIADAIIKYMSARKDLISTLDVKIRVAICKSSPSARACKTERLDTLAQLIAASGISIWRNDAYDFNFSTGVYKCGSMELYITAGEAVALYQRLVRKQETAGWHAFYANMKKKLGNSFLEDLV